MTQYGEDLAGPLTRSAGNGPCPDSGPSMVAFAANQRGELRLEGGDGQIVGALQASQSSKQLQAIAIRTANTSSNGWGISDEPARTLDCACPEAVLCMSDTQAKTVINDTPCLTSHSAKDAPVVAINCRNNCTSEELSGTLQAKANGGTSINYQNPIAIGTDSGYRVRRLTPTECERLQGFPDGWTRVPYRGKPADECPDSPRYKALGNSIAVPCLAWILRRLDEADRQGAVR